MKRAPKTLVLIRHGRTDANDVYSARRRNQPPDLIKEEIVRNLPDWKHDLNEAGIQQAILARQWLDIEMGGVASFDYAGCSPFIRARHTASLLGDPRPSAGWHIDDHFSEQHQGIFSGLTDDERNTNHPETVRHHRMSPWHASYPEGENIMMVRERAQTGLESISGFESSLIVAHAGFIGAMRYHVEGLLPEEYEHMQTEAEHVIKNGSLLMYRSTDGSTGKGAQPCFTEKRLVQPNVRDTYWTPITPSRRFSAQELLEQIRNISL